MDNNRGFGSRIGFIVSMAAFSIGIGNIWKFPYMVGNNGGGAFLLVYLVMVALVGIPGFIIEITLGHKAQFSPIKGMEVLEGKKRTPWKVIGILGFIAIFLISCYATMIIGGWTLGYLVKVLNGSLRGLTSEGVAEVFSSFSGSPIVLIYSAVLVVLMFFCLNSGVKKGVERICSILLPIMLVIMVGLAIFSNLLPGAVSGLKWYLKPDFSLITPSSVAAAATQVFFSIGIGMLCAFVYGSYTKKGTNMTQSAVMIAVLDTIVAVLAGLICVPALFAFGIEPTTGPSLIFVTLPQLFNAMGNSGTVFGALFMLCVFFAGFTSILGGCEAMVSVLVDSKKFSRRWASVLICVVVFLLSILFTFSFGSGRLANFRVIGMGLFDFADFISSLCLCLGALAMVLYVICRWGFKKFQQEANEGSTGKLRVTNWMRVYMNYAFPIILVVVVVCVIVSYF